MIVLGGNMITFEPLWQLLKHRGMTRNQFKEAYDINNSMMDRLRNNKYISTRSLNHLCQILDCKVENIILFLPDRENDL